MLPLPCCSQHTHTTLGTKTQATLWHLWSAPLLRCQACAPPIDHLLRHWPPCPPGCVTLRYTYCASPPSSVQMLATQRRGARRDRSSNLHCLHPDTPRADSLIDTQTARIVYRTFTEMCHLQVSTHTDAHPLAVPKSLDPFTQYTHACHCSGNSHDHLLETAQLLQSQGPPETG